MQRCNFARHRVELLREYQEGYPTRLLLLPKLTCRCLINKDTWEIEVELDGEVSVLRVTTRHLPIVLVKVAYYASGSARFLPKLCSNYARFSKLCYFFKKLFCAQTSQLTRQV